MVDYRDRSTAWWEPTFAGRIACNLTIGSAGLLLSSDFGRTNIALRRALACMTGRVQGQIAVIEIRLRRVPSPPHPCHPD